MKESHCIVKRIFDCAILCLLSFRTITVAPRMVKTNNKNKYWRFISHGTPYLIFEVIAALNLSSSLSVQQWSFSPASCPSVCRASCTDCSSSWKAASAYQAPPGTWRNCVSCDATVRCADGLPKHLWSTKSNRSWRLDLVGHSAILKVRKMARVFSGGVS